MRKKTQKLRPRKGERMPDPGQMVLRNLEVIPGTHNDETRSMDVLIATENPVDRWDEDHGEAYQEILLMDGLQFRNKRQVPIVDSHDRSTVRNVYGSVRDLRTVDPGHYPDVDVRALGGRAFFASDQDSVDAYEKLRDGHLTDFSITATPVEVQTVRRGETVEVGGTEFVGPAELHLAWQPTDASLVAAGADELSTVRQLQRAYEIPDFTEGKPMNKKAKAALVERGMPDSIDTVDEALLWCMQNDISRSDTGTGAKASAGVAVRERIATLRADGMTLADIAAAGELDEVDLAAIVDGGDATDELLEKMRAIAAPQRMDETDEETETVEAAVDRALAQDNDRRREITALAARAGISRELTDQLCNSRVKLETARAKILDQVIENQKTVGSTVAGERITFGANGTDEFRRAAQDGVFSRIMRTIPENPKKPRDAGQYFAGGRAHQGAGDFERAGLYRLAEQILQRGGVNTLRLSKREVALLAMGHRPTVERMMGAGIIRAEGAYHTTGMLPNILLDAANKSLLMGYNEADYTWSLWARQAQSVDDLKPINRIRYSESPDLEHVPENKEYPESKMTDSKESYSVEKFGRIFTTTWETVVNDDLDAIGRQPNMHGNAARRTQNKKVYGVLTANKTLSDNVALFAAGHSNLAGSGAVISTTTLNAAYAAMRVQKGLNSEVTIQVIPRFLIVPAAIEATALEYTTSISPPDRGGSAAGNSNNVNLYGPSGQRSLTTIGEPELDGNSTTAWYLAAASGQIDTVELAFLSGEESPVIESEWEFDRDIWKHKVRQTFGTKAIDYRGLYKNPGA